MKKYFETISIATIAMVITVINDAVSTDGEWIMSIIHDILYTNTDMTWNTCAYISMVVGFVVYVTLTAVAFDYIKKHFNVTKYFKKMKKQAKVNWISVDL